MQDFTTAGINFAFFGPLVFENKCILFSGTWYFTQEINDLNVMTVRPKISNNFAVIHFDYYLQNTVLLPFVVRNVVKRSKSIQISEILRFCVFVYAKG